jgi:hypothetical protein
MFLREVASERIKEAFPRNLTVMHRVAGLHSSTSKFSTYYLSLFSLRVPINGGNVIA